MYVTRPLSLYKTSPEALHTPPPDGPGSGYLIFQDEEYEAQATCCFGLCKDEQLHGLPFPQDRLLTVVSNFQDWSQRHRVYVIPAIDRPLSSNLYYVVFGEGKHMGKISTCSVGEAGIGEDMEPSMFNYRNAYQIVRIVEDGSHGGGHFSGRSAITNGSAQTFLRMKGWSIFGRPRNVCSPGEALGVDEQLRTSMPDLSFSGASSQSMVIGKWYCPFIFVQIPRAKKIQLLYEMTLERYWEEIFSHDSHHHGGNVVDVDICIRTTRALLRGVEEVGDEVGATTDGVRWFWPLRSNGGGVGLSEVIVERMKWEEERGGWIDEEYGVIRRTEVFSGRINGWNKFRCFVLVERFSLKTMDNALLLTYEFKHINKIRCEWE